MSFDPNIPAITYSLFSSFMYDLVKKGMASLNNAHPIKIAIYRTAQEFEGIENLSDTLENWLQGEETQKKLGEFKEGEWEIEIQTLSDSLVGTFGFYYADKSEEKAKEIVLRFFCILKEEYLKSDEAHLYISSRSETIARRTFKEQRQTQKLVKETGAELISKFGKLESALDSRAQVGAWKKKYKSQYTKRIDEARDLLNQGKAKTAKKLYEKLLHDISQEQEHLPKLRFRIFTNLACCEWQLGLEKEAASHYEIAHSFLPKDSKSLANMAVAKMLQGKPEEGLKFINQLLENFPQDIHGICVKANLLMVLKRHSEAIDLFRDEEKQFNGELLEDAQCSYTLGYIYYDNQDYSNARKFLEKAVEKDSSIPDYLSALALSICSPLFKKKSLPWLIPEKDMKDLQDADDCLSQAVKLLKGSEVGQKLETILVNRSSIRTLLGNLKGAADDCKEAIKINPDGSAVYLSKGRVEFLRNNFENAITDFMRAKSKGGDILEIAPRVAYAYLKKKPPEATKAVKFLKRYLPKKVTKESFEGELALAESYICSGEYQKAEDLLMELQQAFPNHPVVLLGFAECKRAAGKQEEAESYLLEAVRYADEVQRQLVFLELAGHYYQRKLYEKAVSYFEKIVNPHINNAVLRQYLVCLYYSPDKNKNYPKCRDICKRIRTEQGATKFVSEIEATIQEELRNLDEASQIYSELSQIEPEKSIHKVRYGLVEFRRGNENRALKILEQVKDKVSDNAEALMSIAEVFDYMGRNQEAIVLGYKALKLVPGDPRMHLAYIYLFLSREGAGEDKLLNPLGVGKDTVVIFKVNGEEKTYMLIDLPQADIGHGEISAGSELGKILQGHKVGDKIKLEESLLEIKEIKSKYVEAFQKSIQDFNVLFLKERGLQTVKVGKNLKGIFKILDEVSARASKATSFYTQRQLTIGALSKLLGRNLFETWSGLVGDPDLSLRCASGTVEEQREEASLVDSSQKIVADLIALFDLARLDCLYIFPQLFQEILVSQSCLDELTQAIGALSLVKKKGYTGSGKYKGQYMMEKITPEDVQKRIDFLSKIKKFVTDECKVCGLRTPLSSLDRRLADMLGTSSVDSIAIAKENSSPLYSDDKSLRELACNKYKVRGFGLQSVLKKALGQNIIQEDTYNEKIVELVLSKHSFISISEKVLFFSAKKNNFKIAPETILLLQTFEPSYVNLNPALKILSAFIKSIWLERILENTKLAYLDLVLRVLTRKRGIRNTLKGFKAHIKKKFNLLPLHCDSILKSIKMWEKSQPLIY